MGKFKEYIISESLGLGDIDSKMNSMVNDPKLGKAISGALVSSNWNNSNSDADLEYANYNKNNKGIDLTVPSIQRQGRIANIMLNKNPIYVRLSDGTEAHFTYDQWRKIEGSPKVGKIMTIIFQRHPEDMSSERSKIDKAIVTD